MRSTHSDRLERWLGAEKVSAVTQSMKNWYGPPIALQGVPGQVWAAKGGDFVGRINAGQECSARDRALDLYARIRRMRIARSRRQLGAFASIDEISAALKASKGRTVHFQKNGGGVFAAGVCASLARVGTTPIAMSAASAAPGGSTPTSATAGALFFRNADSANTLHFLRGEAAATVAANNLLLYDRIFAVVKTMNSSATEAVTGVPARYQSATATAENYAGGNFVFPEVGTNIANTAHNWTVCQYTDQAGNTAQSIPSIAGTAATQTPQLDLPAGNWFMPLAAADSGVKALTQMQCSALVATGAIDFVIGHPIAFIPCVVAGLLCAVEGLYTAFNLTRVYDDACLALLEITHPSTTACNYSGQIQLVGE